MIEVLSRAGAAAKSISGVPWYKGFVSGVVDKDDKAAWGQR
jgi:hypothetical protein